MITAAWPGQPWLDRKIREGDTILVTGRVKFFHGRQIQPRELMALVQVVLRHTSQTEPRAETKKRRS